MLWVDTAIIVLMVIYLVYGFLRGFSQEIFALAVWVTGVIVGWFFSTDFSVLLGRYYSAPQARLAASFVALMALTLLVGFVIRILLGDAVKKNGLNMFDRLGGLVLGVCHGLLVITVFTIISGLTPLPGENWWFKSKYLPPFQALASFGKSHITNALASAMEYPNQPR